jgi:hypothetical protein
VDPYSTKKSLEDYLKETSEWNTVICPLNTKLSTVGAALFCIEHQDAQLCYAQPIEYNYNGYASAGDSVTIIELS